MGKSSSSLFVTNGCSNHSDCDRADLDFYSSDPKAAEWLLQLEPDISDNIWECACGSLSLSDVFTAAGKHVRNSDIIARKDGIEILDFLTCETPMHDADIITNPPYNKAKDFVEKALSLVDDGRYVCMFLKLTFLEGKSRRSLFDKYPPIRVWVSTSRMKCYMNGVSNSNNASAVCYAWFVWKKGYKGYPEIRWFN